MALAFVLGGGCGCGNDAEPVVGPASDGLVFVHLIDGSEDLVRGRLHDGAEANLTETPERRERWPVWSESANALAYEVQDLSANARSDLSLWRPDGGGEESLTRTPARRETWASWSPVERRITYAFRGGGSRGPGGGIALRDLDRDSAVPLARVGEEAGFIRPHFGPEGRLIVVQRKVPRSGSHLWIVGFGLKPHALTRDPEWFDMKGWFTRDGKRIVYTRRPMTGGPHQIASVGAAGEAVRVLAASDGPHDDHSARPSPTRDEVVFVSDRDGSPDLYLAGLRGDAVRRLTHSSDESEYAPRWSPDGERIVATVTPTAAGQPRLVDPEGLEQARVKVFDREGRILFEAQGFMPDWMPPWP